MEEKPNVEVEGAEEYVHITYTLESFIELLDKFMIYREQININLASALYMLANEIKQLKIDFECCEKNKNKCK